MLNSDGKEGAAGGIPSAAPTQQQTTPIQGNPDEATDASLLGTLGNALGDRTNQTQSLGNGLLENTSGNAEADSGAHSGAANVTDSTQTSIDATGQSPGSTDQEMREMGMI